MFTLTRQGCSLEDPLKLELFEETRPMEKTPHLANSNSSVDSYVLPASALAKATDVDGLKHYHHHHKHEGTDAHPTDNTVAVGPSHSGWATPAWHNRTDTPMTIKRDAESVRARLDKVKPIRRLESAFAALESVKDLMTAAPPVSTAVVRKNVQFVDTQGKQLHELREIFDQDEPPEVPEEAWAYLEDTDDDVFSLQGAKFLVVKFGMPASESNFLGRVHAERVSLEYCVPKAIGIAMTGSIRVANISDERKVYVRYTVNKWATYIDSLAAYITGATNAGTELYAFDITMAVDLPVGTYVEFAIRYNAVSLRQEYWDNNGGLNYQMECHQR